MNLRPRLRDPQRGESPADQIHERVDEDTGELWLCKGDALADSMDGIEPIVQLTFRTTVVGQDGHILGVDADGAASVNVQNAPGTRPRVNSTPWNILIARSVATTTFATLAAATTLQGVVDTSTDAAAAGAAALANPDGYEAAYLIFGGSTTADQTFLFRVTRVYKMQIGPSNVAWVPAMAGQGQAILGSPTMGAGGAALGTSTDEWCDEINVSSPPAGVMVVTGGVANMNLAVMVVDMMCSDALIIEVDNEGPSAATMNVFGKLGDYPRTMADETLLKVYSHANKDLDVTQA